MLFCGLTDAGVLLLPFIPGVWVVQHSADRENERSIKKLCRAAAETVGALRACLEQVILRIRLRREPRPPRPPLQSLEGRPSVREASLPEICPLAERRTLEVGSLKAHLPRERRLVEADMRRERRLTKVGILREGRVIEVRSLREVHLIARPRKRNKRRPAERGVAVEPRPTKILVLREGRPR